MTETSATPIPTVESNSEAASRARHLERNRVLDLLDSVAAEIPEAIMTAVANGIPAAIFATNQRVLRNKGVQNPGGAARPEKKNSWKSTTARLNEQRSKKASATKEQREEDTAK